MKSKRKQNSNIEVTHDLIMKNWKNLSSEHEIWNIGWRGEQILVCLFEFKTIFYLLFDTCLEDQFKFALFKVHSNSGKNFFIPKTPLDKCPFNLCTSCDSFN